METQDEKVKISKYNFVIRISWASNSTFIGSLRSILSLLIIIKGSWIAKTELFGGGKIESTHYQDLVIETSKFGLMAKKIHNTRLNWHVAGVSKSILNEFEYGRAISNRASEWSNFLLDWCEHVCLRIRYHWVDVKWIHVSIKCTSSTSRSP